MKAIYVIQPRDYSGAEILNVPLMRADPDPLLACPPGSRVESLATSLGVPTTALAHRAMRHSGGRLELLRSVGRGLLGARDLRRILRAHPDRQIVFAVSLRPGLMASLAVLGLRRQVVWSLTDFLPPAPLLAAVIRLVASLTCDLPIAISRSVAVDFAGGWRSLRNRTKTVFPGVDPERFSACAPRPGSPRAVLLGQVSPTKRTDMAIEVARLVGRQTGDFQLEVIGRAQFRDEDFALERELHARVEAEPALRDHVRFLGYCDDIPTRLAASGLLLHFCPHEPLGMAVLEAMAAGLPVVVPDAHGPAELVEHDVTGLLYAAGDAQAAVACVLRLLSDPREAERLGARARSTVLTRWTIEAQVAATFGLLDRLAAQV